MVREKNIKRLAVKDFEAYIPESNNQEIHLMMTVLAVLHQMFGPQLFELIVKKCLDFWTFLVNIQIQWIFCHFGSLLCSAQIE